VQLNDWQIAEIKKGPAEADRGEFATDEEMNSIFVRGAQPGANNRKT